MAGSPCPVEVMNKVVDKMNMKEIVIVFGQTEASPGCTMTTTEDSLEKRVATVGRAFPGVECKIINPDTGEEQPRGTAGEFCARGYNVMKGYYKMPEATAQAIDEEGWLHSGDLCVEDEEGYFKVVGRIKDMIIRGGENVYPKEIEEFLYTLPEISDVQVVGVPSVQYGEEVMAFIILKQGEEMTEEEVKAAVRRNMARHKVPKYVKFVDKFPVTASGKIQKFKLREQAIELLRLQEYRNGIGGEYETCIFHDRVSRLVVGRNCYRGERPQLRRNRDKGRRKRTVRTRYKTAYNRQRKVPCAPRQSEVADILPYLRRNVSGVRYDRKIYVGSKGLY